MKSGHASDNFSKGTSERIIDPVQACVLTPELNLSDDLRRLYAQCLGWQPDWNSPICYGSYKPLLVTPLDHPEEVRLLANQVSFYHQGRSYLKGDVEVQQGLRVVNAQTAYVYRDAKTNKVNQIELLGQVRYLEPDRLMLAKKAVINPQDQSGRVEDVLYRFNTSERGAVLPAWGRAALIQRFPNKNYTLKNATYSNCAPQDNAWEIQAKEINLDYAKAKGEAWHAVLRLRDIPVFYTPYISFPTNKERKSGFLMPLVGYSDAGGYDLALPFYWNIAPNADATLIPHYYEQRGVMLGGQYRFLSNLTSGSFEANYLANDRAFSEFIHNNSDQYPFLKEESTRRWSVNLHQTLTFNPNLYAMINVKQVSDDYFLQDFTTNLAAVTQRQLLRQANLIYNNTNWIFSALVQGYQTLNPINLAPVLDIYERLPQLRAKGYYYKLPYNATVSLLGQYDQFHWPNDQIIMPQGPRVHFNPQLTFPMIKPWGFLKPSFEWIENYYDVNIKTKQYNENFNLSLPRYSLDTGLNFERQMHLYDHPFTQTLEPRLYYLYVPYRDQTKIPVYDSAYMIFNFDQLYRNNRFSGFDRIGDTNQLTYSLTSRWLSDESGAERASFSIGQIYYFEKRKVELCYSQTGFCNDSRSMLGYRSTNAGASPIVTRATYHLSPSWIASGDYVWDPATQATNNSHINFHYQPLPNRIFDISYSYLVNGDFSRGILNIAENNALHQATVAYAWPINDHWSSLGAYSYNISKGYGMMSFLGLQYDSCCWAMRIMGGRTFKNLNPAATRPEYNNNIYLQILLKGLGSVASSDPYSTINSYIPGYIDQFHR